MKDYDQKFLENIQEKYAERIRVLYQPYVPDFDKRAGLAENVFLLDDWKYNLRFRGNTRAVTRESDGRIYLKRSTASEYVLVHEYIHRLSTHPIHPDSRFTSYRIGLADIYKGIHLLGINEILTEWHAVQVTGVEPGEGLAHNIYQGYFPLFKDIFENPKIRERMTKAFFAGDMEAAVQILLTARGCSLEELQQDMNELSENIIHRKPNG